MLTPDQAAAELSALYGTVLGRIPDAAASATLIPELESGLDPAILRIQLATGSVEATTAIQDFFLTELGRPVTQAELPQFLAALSNGSLSLAAERGVIGTSPEAASGISALYTQILGRPADPAGAAQFGAALGSGLSLTDIRQSIATSPEAQATLATAYETNFGTAPTAGTLAAQQTELALGRPLSDVVQVTAKSLGGGASLFSHNYGYSIPAQYAASGQAQFLSIFDNSYRLYQGSVTTVAVPAASTAPGPDTITLDVQTASATPVSFIALLDGHLIGSATASAPRATLPFASSVQDEISFTGSFGPGLHDLHIQLTTDPANNLGIQTGGTFDGNAFLLGGITTGATGAADIFPHAGPQPPQLFGS